MRDRIVAHRGNAVEFRENSLHALQSAIDLGCRYMEFDVRLSSDGVPCLLHDAYLTRLFGKDREACGTTWADLKGFGIQSLADAVALLGKSPEVQAFVEIKVDNPGDLGRAGVANAILDQIPAGQCIAISFDIEACQVARQRGYRIGWIVTDLSDATRDTCMALAPEYVFCDQRHIQSMVWPGPIWCSYEVSNVDTAVRLMDCGVQLLETMSVRKLMQ